MENDKFYVRFFNAVPDLGEVEFYVNGKLVGSLWYKGFSEYFPAIVGTYKVAVYNKKTKELLIEEEVMMQKDIYTFVLSGLGNDVALNLVSSNGEQVEKDKALIRFCNVAPFDTSFDIYLNDKQGVNALMYEEITEFLALNAGSYDMKATDAQTGETKLLDPRLVLKNGNAYTGYIVGVEGKGKGLEIVIPLEGMTYINL